MAHGRRCKAVFKCGELRLGSAPAATASQARNPGGAQYHVACVDAELPAPGALEGFRDLSREARAELVAALPPRPPRTRRRRADGPPCGRIPYLRIGDGGSGGGGLACGWGRDDGGPPGGGHAPAGHPRLGRPPPSFRIGNGVWGWPGTGCPGGTGRGTRR